MWEVHRKSLHLHFPHYRLPPFQPKNGGLMNQNHEMDAARNLCWDCRDVCQDVLYNHILTRGSGHIHAENIRMLTDCIQICQVAADFMRRNSRMHIHTCDACADICAACADSCEHMGKEHTEIQRCAEICRKCSESCRKMSS